MATNIVSTGLSDYLSGKLGVSSGDNYSSETDTYVDPTIKSFSDSPLSYFLSSKIGASSKVSDGYAKAADRYAAISREQWNNYKKFGYPIEDYLLSQIGNKELLASDLQSATQNAQLAGNTAEQSTARRMASYGINQTSGQAATDARLNNLTSTANIASARDAARENAKERDMNILIGTAPNDGLTDV